MIKIKDINVRYGELGYNYAINKIDQKNIINIEKIQFKTKMIIEKQSSKVFNIENNIFNYLCYYTSKILTKFLIKKKYLNFSNDIGEILNNIKIYSDIAKKNKIKIYNLSKKSNLNKVKNITYLKKYSS